MAQPALAPGPGHVSEDRGFRFDVYRAARAGVILEEWPARIPEFHLASGEMPAYMSGIVSAVSPFELERDV